MWPEVLEVRRIRKGHKQHCHYGKWNAQWMQNPTAEEGAILKREWWQTYKNEDIPQLQHVIQSYDTAFLKKRQLTTVL